MNKEPLWRYMLTIETNKVYKNKIIQLHICIRLWDKTQEEYKYVPLESMFLGIYNESFNLLPDNILFVNKPKQIKKLCLYSHTIVSFLGPHGLIPIKNNKYVKNSLLKIKNFLNKRTSISNVSDLIKVGYAQF